LLDVVVPVCPSAATTTIADIPATPIAATMIVFLTLLVFTILLFFQAGLLASGKAMSILRSHLMLGIPAVSNKG
jgi:hypothetical protein